MYFTSLIQTTLENQRIYHEECSVDDHMFLLGFHYGFAIYHSDQACRNSYAAREVWWRIMWPFKKKKLVLIVVINGSTFYLNEDLSYGKSIKDALGFDSFIDAHSVALRLRRYGADAATAEIVCG